MPKIREKLKDLEISIMIVPFILIVVLSYFFFMYPKDTKDLFTLINPFFRDKLSMVYLFINLIVFIFSFYLAFSKYGNIKLGDKDENPRFSFFS